MLFEQATGGVWTLKLVAALSLSLLAWTDARAADPIALSFPLKCELGTTCFVQSYVDHDLSNGSRDYQCLSLIHI